jgi:hypothetical protein
MCRWGAASSFWRCWWGLLLGGPNRWGLDTVLGSSGLEHWWMAFSSRAKRIYWLWEKSLPQTLSHLLKHLLGFNLLHTLNVNLICNNLYLNFNIWYYTDVCWLCSRFTENRSRWSLSMNPLPEVVLSQLVIRVSLRQHSRYLTNTLCQWGSLSPYKDCSSLLRWQTNIFVHIPLRNCINEGMWWFFVC